MSFNTNPLFKWASLVLLAGSLAGCGGSAQSRMSRYEKAFNTAPQELKAQWDIALNAVKSKDYAVAVGTLNQIAVITNLAPEQAVAVREVSTAVSDEMYDAANKGDPKAKQAIEDLRKSRR
jgi:hypothetical protein